MYCFVRHCNAKVRQRPIGLLALSLLVLIGILLGNSKLLAQVDQSNSRLDEYLKKHGLTELTEASYLRRINDAKRREDKITIARELAFFYIDRSEENVHGLNYDELLLLLLKDFPELEDRQFEIARLQASYRNNKELFQLWIESNRSAELQKQLHRGWDILNQQLIQFLEYSDASTDSTTTSTFSSQATYLLAWTNYYHAISTADLQQKDRLLQQANDEFRELLNLADDQNILELETDWLNLESIWNVRCLIGLAMVAQASNNESVASSCFAQIESSQSWNTIREEMLLWRFHSYYFAGLIDKAESYCEQLFSRHKGSAELWMSLVVAGQVWIDPESTSARRITLVGLAGLAKLNRFDLVVEQINTHSIKLTPNSFYSSWIAAKVYVERYESSLGQDDLEKAHDLIQTALGFSNRVNDSDSVANAKWLNAWIEYKQGNLESATKSFKEVAELLRNSRPDLSSHALWMRIQMLEKLTAKEARYQIQLAAANSELRRWFPNSKYVEIAEFERERKQIKLLPASESIRRLNLIGPQNPNYETAQFDIVQATFREHLESMKRNGSVQEVSLNQLEKRVDDFFANFPTATPARKLSCGLVMVQSLNSQKRFDTAMSWLEKLRPLAESLAHEEDLKDEFHFYLMRINEQNADIEAAESSASWLAAHGNSSSMRSTGLIWLATQAHERLESAKGEARHPLRKRAIGFYSKLLNELEQNSNQPLGNTPNLRTTLFRLAELHMESGTYTEAIRHFKRLVEDSPDNGTFIVGLARSLEYQNQSNEALDYWRTLARGFNAGSPIWIEAKYYIIRSTLRSDKSKAKLIFDQTLQLARSIPVEWQARYDELRNQLAN